MDWTGWWGSVSVSCEHDSDFLYCGFVDCGALWSIINVSEEHIASICRVEMLVTAYKNSQPHNSEYTTIQIFISVKTSNLVP
jgi:hypothetical protein